ncbi:MAG: hypothetical protein A2V88_07725 [Elusimicrobia bacterium RBG_16_66_12]|nr:MAG: hypothetical protein A2V88_07725 [Elusimicrobia bacterium RBG_16_66_12]
MPVELILAGNGPGELSGWIAPVARAARSAAGNDLRLTLALSPSQFASGRESDVVRGWNLFDRVLDPRTCLRVASGLQQVPVDDASALIHLGGDLWLSGRLAARLRIPACALVETVLIARRHAAFRRIFAVSDALARQLAERGVSPAKIVTTGDPRGDAMGTTPRAGTSPAARGEDAFVVSILPGSRDRVYTVLVPYFLRVAHALAAAVPDVRFNIIVSPYLSRDAVAAVRADASRQWPSLALKWVTEDGWAALAASDFVLTIPGTNTLELAMLAIPFAVVVDTTLVPLASMEGALEWITRVPGIGPALRRRVLMRYLARLRFASLPNIRLGRAVVPEWVGRWPPEELAKQVAAWLQAPDKREALRRELQETFALHPGAAQAIASSALELAAARGRTR